MRISDWSSDVCSSDLSCFGKNQWWAALRKHAQKIGFLHDQVVLPVDLDLGAGPLAVKDLVTGLDVQRSDLAALVPPARSAERRVGKESVITSSSRCSQTHSKKKNKSTSVSIHY